MTTVMTRKTKTMKKKRRSIVDTRESLKSETDLVSQVEGVGQLVSTCVDALQVSPMKRDWSGKVSLAMGNVSVHVDQKFQA